MGRFWGRSDKRRSKKRKLDLINQSRQITQSGARMHNKLRTAPQPLTPPRIAPRDTADTAPYATSASRSPSLLLYHGAASSPLGGHPALPLSPLRPSRVSTSRHHSFPSAVAEGHRLLRIHSPEAPHSLHASAAMPRDFERRCQGMWCPSRWGGSRR